MGRRSYTKQIQDFQKHAAEKGLYFNLVVRSGTKLSGPLQAQVDAGAIYLLRSL